MIRAPYARVAATLFIAIAITIAVLRLQSARRASILESRRENFRICLELVTGDDGLQSPIDLSTTDENREPAVSWRFRRYLELHPVPRQGSDFKASWRASVNAPFREKILAFACFSNSPMTSVMAVGGHGTVFDKSLLRPLAIRGDTLLIVEVFQRQIHWMQPGDLDVDVQSSIMPSSDLGEGFFAGFADGSVWRFRKETPIEVVFTLAKIERPRDDNFDHELEKYVLYRPLTQNSVPENAIWGVTPLHPAEPNE